MAIMGNIYQDAFRSVAWLGNAIAVADEPKDGEMAFGFIKAFAKDAAEAMESLDKRVTQFDKGEAFKEYGARLIGDGSSPD